MKLSQVYIQHYGPFQKELSLEPEINVIQGPNESGKSLLVEALLKKFVDGSIPSPRIDEHPEGFIEFEVKDGSKNKLGDGESLTSFFSEYYNAEVRPDEVQNIFVVRNGDLGSGHDEDFYSHITDKLTGRRVEDIDTVKDELFDAGRLTRSRKNISSDNKYDDAGNQVEEARELRSDIESYLESAEEDELSRKEGRYFAAKNEEEGLEGKVSTYEAAKTAFEKTEKLVQLTKDKNAIESNLDKLGELCDEDDLEDINARLQTLSEEEGKEGELIDRKVSNLNLAKWSIAVGGLGFIVSLVFNAGIAGAVFGFGFLVAGIYFWSKANQLSDDINTLQATEERILSDARAAGLEFENRNEIRNKIAKIEDNRDTLEKDNQGTKAVLERELDFETDSMGDAVERAADKLRELEESIDDSVEIEYDEDEAAATKQAFRDARERRKRLEQEIEEHRDELRKFADRANHLDFNIFVGERLNLEIENLDALQRLVDRLTEFIDAIESDAEASRIAIEIFDEIQSEEREETAELFEEGSRATELFRKITDDRYSQISYDNEENQLIVEKSTGERFEPENLSDGTKDQLYLAIRVAIAEQILEGETGFFLMDDAFLTSDANRLSIQGDIVEDLAQGGWQIVYLTCKQDAIDELTTRSGRDPIELPSLE